MNLLFDKHVGEHWINHAIRQDNSVKKKKKKLLELNFKNC